MERYLIGGVVAIAFIAFIVLLVMADKKANKKFAAKIAAEHHMKDQYGKFIVTEEGEFMFSLPSGSLEGYKLWKLSDIGAIAVHNNQFTIMDPSQKASKGGRGYRGHRSFDEGKSLRRRREPCRH